MRLWLNTPSTVSVGPFPSRRAAKLCWKAGQGPGEWDHIPAASVPLCFCPQGSAAPEGTGQVRVLLSTPSTSWAPQPRLPAERFFDILHPGPIPSPGPEALPPSAPRGHDFALTQEVAAFPQDRPAPAADVQTQRHAWSYQIKPAPKQSSSSAASQEPASAFLF